jgi:hypothetical protein
MMKQYRKGEQRRNFNPELVIVFVPFPSKDARESAYEQWVELYLEGRRLEIAARRSRASKDNDDSGPEQKGNEEGCA